MSISVDTDVDLFLFLFYCFHMFLVIFNYVKNNISARYWREITWSSGWYFPLERTYFWFLQESEFHPQTRVNAIQFLWKSICYPGSPSVSSAFHTGKWEGTRMGHHCAYCLLRILSCTLILDALVQSLESSYGCFTFCLFVLFLFF